MNKILRKISVATLIALFGVTSAWAVPETDTGTVDNLIAQAPLANSGSGAEEAWIAAAISTFTGTTVAAGDLDFTKFDDGTAGWLQVTRNGDDLAGIFARLFVGEPEYFMVKIGDGNGTGAEDSHFLYQNISELLYAVIDMQAFGVNFVLTNINVSHTVTVGDGAQVPAPGSAALLGFGLLGFGLRRLRKRK